MTPGVEPRISLLQQLATQLVSGAPLLLSFYPRDKHEWRFRLSANVGKCVKLVTCGEDIEVGDYLATDYVHFFTREELQRELCCAGFELVFFQKTPYGHAIARRNSSPVCNRAYRQRGEFWGQVFGVSP